ncbi:MAG: hypothetical protein HUJ29_01115 [Gammaproteobacteria bacterium]|nr:hypothetical protein [Gammaproteobacteria bacterium]
MSRVAQFFLLLFLPLTLLAEPNPQWRYHIYNTEDELLGEYVVTLTSSDASRQQIQGRMQMSGSWMMIQYELSGKEAITIDEQGIAEFVLIDDIDSSLMSGTRRTHGKREDNVLTLTIRKDGETEVKQFSLDSFDTIRRINTKQQKAYAKMLRAAPASFRSLNIMQGEIEEIEIEDLGVVSMQLDGRETRLEKYRIKQPGFDSEVWLLPDGTVYRNGGRFGYSMLHFSPDDW